MSIELFIYLAGLVGNLQSVMTVTLVIGGVGTLLYYIFSITEGVEPEDLKRWPVIVLLGLALLTAAIPSERTMWLMAGAHVTQELLQSSTGKKVADLVNSKLEDAVRDAARGERR